MLVAENITVDVATSIWTLIAAVAAAFAAAIAALGVAVQYFENRRARGLDFLWRSIEAWDGPEMRLQRSQVALDLLSDPPQTSRLTSEVLNFLDLVGLYVRMGAVPVEAAWSAYCVFVFNYRSACLTKIEKLRKDDPAVWAELEFLFNKFVEIEQKKLAERRKQPVKPEDVPPGTEETTEFLQAEAERWKQRVNQKDVVPGTKETAEFLQAEADLRFIARLPPPPDGSTIPTSPLPSRDTTNETATRPSSPPASAPSARSSSCH